MTGTIFAAFKKIAACYEGASSRTGGWCCEQPTNFKSPDWATLLDVSSWAAAQKVYTAESRSMAEYSVSFAVCFVTRQKGRA